MIATGTKMTHIPYKGMGAAYADLIAGNIELSFPTIVSSQAHIRAGRLRGLAVTGSKRAPAMPELPTMAEAGVSGVVARGTQVAGGGGGSVLGQDRRTDCTYRDDGEGERDQSHRSLLADSRAARTVPQNRLASSAGRRR